QSTLSNSSCASVGLGSLTLLIVYSPLIQWITYPEHTESLPRTQRSNALQTVLPNIAPNHSLIQNHPLELLLKHLDRPFLHFWADRDNPCLRYSSTPKHSLPDQLRQ